jgi:hypothetical protein
MTQDLSDFLGVETPLKNLVIEGIDVTHDSISIRLNTNIGPIIGVCDADCCSETWIENVELPALGFPCRLITAEHLNMPEGRDSEGDELQEYIQFYGIKLTTDKGEIIIEYRNASNGYYGGDLLWGDRHYYGGVNRQQIPSDEWISTDEWLSRKTLKLEV